MPFSLVEAFFTASANQVLQRAETLRSNTAIRNLNRINFRRLSSPDLIAVRVADHSSDRRLGCRSGWRSCRSTTAMPIVLFSGTSIYGAS